MKKKKISLQELSVKSFVTRPGQLNTRTYKGGTQIAIPVVNPIDFITQGSRSALDYCCYPDSGKASCYHDCNSKEYFMCQFWDDTKAEGCTVTANAEECR